MSTERTPLAAVPRVHPSEIVRDYLESYNITEDGLPEALGLPKETVQEFMRKEGKITPAMASALNQVFKRPVDFWLNLQKNYDKLIGD